MYWCCRELGIDWRVSKYCILGDDVLIGDRELAILYKDTIRRLGVDISETKTHQSGKLFEFAKRLVYEGSEITPFPISSLNETCKKGYLFTNLLMEEERKGWSWRSGIPLTAEKFSRLVLRMSSRMGARYEETSYLSELMMKIMRGALPANHGLNAMVRRYGLQLPEINDYQGISILSGTALSVFADSNPLDHTQGKPLGQLAQDLVMEISSIEEFPVDASPSWELPSKIPILNLFGQVSESYMKLAKEAYLIDTIGKGEWPMHLRTMALPFSDSVFKERASHTIIRVGAVLGKRVLESLRGLRPRDLS